MPKNDQVEKCQDGIMTTFGEFLRRHRELKELTQDKFAKLLDIPYTDVSKIERGKKKFPFSKLDALSEFFGLNFEETKDLYVADILIQQARKYECTERVFSVAEKQVKYIRNKTAKQSKMDI